MPARGRGAGTPDACAQRRPGNRDIPSPRRAQPTQNPARVKAATSAATTPQGVVAALVAAFTLAGFWVGWALRGEGTSRLPGRR